MSTIKHETSGHTVARINRAKKRIEYFVSPKSYQYPKLGRIDLDGFTELPPGLYRDGKGLHSPAGSFFLSALHAATEQKFSLTLSKKGASRCIRRGRRWEVTLNFVDYSKLLKELQDIRADKNSSSKALVNARLATMFPKLGIEASQDVDSPHAYIDDKISKILKSTDNVLDKLSKADVAAIAEAYGALRDGGLLKSAGVQINVLAKDKSVSERVYLEQVIAKFEQLMRGNNSEAKWQAFLRDYILLFNTSYVGLVEKQNISLAGNLPDFILLDVYGYADVYEIKKPNTNLLRYDDSRDNYFWDTELSKAISQVENYLACLDKNAGAIRDVVERRHGKEARVVSPRGFIIAGSSSQLTDQKMKDDFRLLANSLKNVDVVLYDDLLANLKNLVSRLAGKKAKGAVRRAKRRKRKKT